MSDIETNNNKDDVIDDHGVILKVVRSRALIELSRDNSKFLEINLGTRMREIEIHYDWFPFGYMHLIISDTGKQCSYHFNDHGELELIKEWAEKYT